MLISALNDYYDVLARKNKLVQDGYSKVKIHFLIGLDENGNIKDIINNQVEEKVMVGKKEKVNMVAKEFLLTRRTEKPGIESNIIEHRPLYIFGLNFLDNVFTPDDKTNKARKSHEAFVKANLEFIEGINSPVVNAFRNFLINYKPEEHILDEKLITLGKVYSVSSFGFCLAGDSDVLLNDDIEIKKKWNTYYAQKNAEEKGQKSQCAICGEYLPIARIHNKIKGFTATGSVLIGYKNASDSSYSNEQAYNSNVSKQVMERYTGSLNYLMSQKSHRTNIDDMTIIYFAMDGNEECEEEFTKLMFEDEVDGKLNDIMNKYVKELSLNQENIGDVALDKISSDTSFYIFAFKPNSSRLALKFIYRKSFGDVMKNIALHQLDLKLSDKSKVIPLWRIMSELKPTTNKNTDNDQALQEKIITAIINGYNYPYELLDAVIRRIKTDSDTDKFKKISSTRVAIIKACLNRNNRFYNKTEEISMALNTENKNQAYLCGRLFAVLEKLQEDASGGNLNRTIKDSYFASACSTPAIVFPKLLRLAQNHISKANYGPQLNYSIGQIMNLLGSEFPKTLSLTQQGNFVIGYYQESYKNIKTKSEETK